MAPRRDFEEERKPPSKRNWQRRPERGDDQPRDKRPARQKRPDEVVWDWEDDTEPEEVEDDLDEAGEDGDDDQDDVVWDDDDR